MKYILICLLLLSSCATPEKIHQISTNDYQIIGKLDRDEYDKIISIIKEHPNERVNFHVFSIGGTSNHLFEAMDAIYNHGDVHWISTELCDSACAIMALSTKHAEGTFRVHSFYKIEQHHIYPAPEFNEKVLEHLKNYGYDTDKFNYMFYSVEELWPITIHDGIIEE